MLRTCVTRTTGWLCLSAALLASAPSTATPVVGVDVVGTLLWSERSADGSAPGTTARSNASTVRDLLVDPSSPYSDVKTTPALVNSIEWQDVLDGFQAKGLTQQDALAVLHWDLGMSRARIGIDVPVDTAGGYRDRFVAASARKADVDADIFWQMLDLTGFRHSATAAYYAVGLQILRSQVRATPLERRAALGIDTDVFDRVMTARRLDQLADYDLRYLSTLIQHRLVHWRPGSKASTGLRELPVSYRIARVAAAYRDAEGYFVGAPCYANGTPAPNVAGTGAAGDPRDLCFVAATDRAVHRWYLEEARAQSRPRAREMPRNGMALLGAIIGVVFPLLEFASALEVTEAVVADDLVSTRALAVEDAEIAAERADLLTCRLP